jgi:hypothetical protein
MQADGLHRLRLADCPGVTILQLFAAICSYLQLFADICRYLQIFQAAGILVWVGVDLIWIPWRGRFGEG